MRSARTIVRRVEELKRLEKAQTQNKKIGGGHILESEPDQQTNEPARKARGSKMAKMSNKKAPAR